MRSKTSVDGSAEPCGDEDAGVIGAGRAWTAPSLASDQSCDAATSVHRDDEQRNLALLALRGLAARNGVDAERTAW